MGQVIGAGRGACLTAQRSHIETRAGLCLAPASVVFADVHRAALRLPLHCAGGEAAMATGPGEGLDVAGRGHLRASHADREQVVGTLKAAFVQGRLTKDELDARAGQVFAARTYAELAAVTADLPAGLADPRPPAPARGSVNKKKRAVVALSFATLALASLLAVPTPSMPDGPFTLLIILVFWCLLSAVATGWLWLFHAWLDQRADRPSARGLPPGPSGQASQRLPPADPGRRLPPGDDRRWHTADAAPISRPRLQPS
jgi:hypothetical protein